jgi:hypothetical protein
MSLLSDPYTWGEWNHNHDMDIRLVIEHSRKNISIARPIFVRTEELKERHASLASHPNIVRKMHPTLLLPTLFYIVTLLPAVPVRVLFISVLLENSS